MPAQAIPAMKRSEIRDLSFAQCYAPHLAACIFAPARPSTEYFPVPPRKDPERQIEPAPFRSDPDNQALAGLMSRRRKGATTCRHADINHIQAHLARSSRCISSVERNEPEDPE